ncbi:mitochondrial proton/calcium exchanger protein-like isoform X2 [Babylonia areolata]|uniref:mitochondrial proton/calcium exchanger protein-like isoform X2 n=1 Tax=Babylonia areolata TaxID=304850 RepID=UPI003FD48F4F
MSRIILGPSCIAKFLAKGRLLQVNGVQCGCKCHMKYRIRTLSTQSNASSECEIDAQASRQRIRQVDLHGFSVHRRFIDSYNFLQPGASSFIRHRNCEGVVLRPLHFSSTCDLTYAFSNYNVASSFHTSVRAFKEESKVEKSVKALKEKVEQLEKQEEEKGKVTVAHEEPIVVVPVKKPLWQRFVAELKHYYHGFRLLFIDVRICSRLLWKVLHGSSLTRRERQQLVRTTADMFRLVPFLVFLLVPFMELLLPVAIKLFPNMLPSTFAEKNKVLENRKKNLKLKLEMAKFLQDTIRESALQKKKKKGSAAEEFSQFVEKIRSQGIRPTTQEILKFAKLFEDEITLDNLSRQQLQAVCRVLNIQPIGIDAFLRFQLEIKLRQLKADDQMIVKEGGVDRLSVPELQAANRARGMRAMGVDNERLKAQLQQWLTLHLEEKIPTSLLLLSRALYLPETLSTEEQLQATISELTQTAPTATDEVKLKVAELAGEEVDNKTRLEVIKKEEDIIAAEREARKEEEARLEEEARIQQERAAAASAESLVEPAAVDSKEAVKDVAPVVEPAKSEELVDKAPELTGIAGEELVTPKEEEAEDESITVKELEEIESALEEIAQQKRLDIEKEELEDLKEEVDEYKEDLEDLKEVMMLTGKEPDALRESKAAKRLIKRVDRIIQQADSVMQELEVEKDQHKVDIEAIEDQLKQSADLKEEDRKVAVEEVMRKIKESRDKIVGIEEMMAAMKDLQKVPNETKLQHILEVLDEDHDGNIDINLALKVLEALGQEKIKLNKDQVTEMINLLKAEMQLEKDSKEQKKVV